MEMEAPRLGATAVNVPIAQIGTMLDELRSVYSPNGPSKPWSGGLRCRAEHPVP
jgi:hypothetical protein